MPLLVWVSREFLRLHPALARADAFEQKPGRARGEIVGLRAQVRCRDGPAKLRRWREARVPVLWGWPDHRKRGVRSPRWLL